MTKLGLRKLLICPKVTKMGSIIGHRIDYNGVGAHTQVPPPPDGQSIDRMKSETATAANSVEWFDLNTH